MWCTIKKLIRSNSGAVAPTIALSLTALVATGGIAFDYARIANLDTELQQAADQAALAAATQLDGSNDPYVMGHPRDLCHAASENGICGGGIIGNGNWDRDAFFRVNYGWDHVTWVANTGLGETPSRYQVYLWESNNPLPNGASGRGLGNSQGPFPAGHGNGSTDGEPVCRPPGIAPGNLDTDRRVMAVAVIDCTGLNGRDTVVPADWVDVFLVEPTIRRVDGSGSVRTDDGDVYVEIIGTRPLPGVNQSVGDVIRRDVPRLIE